MVMVENSDVRANRLALLHKILQLASPWGDFEKLS
jgi:glycyl-tRNA synthetase beta subunit